MKKSTLYIDIEDDIASIIEKVSQADEKIVALVLPKRPSVLQSSVNVRLLKKGAEDVSKSLVLITNDDQVKRLAGQVELYVSSSLQSKPTIPAIKESPVDLVDEVVDSGDSSLPLAIESEDDPAQPDVYKDDQKIDLKTPVGQLVEDDEIEIDNTDADDLVVDEAKGRDKIPKKRIAIPSFSSFRNKLLIVGSALVVLAVFLFWALMIAPRATVELTTTKRDKSTRLDLLITTADQTSEEEPVLKATKKDDTQRLNTSFQATGQRNVGERATGNVSFRNCESSSQIVIPSGTGVSRGGLTFITQESVTLSGGTFSGGGSNCTSSESGAVGVVASEPGDQYNVSSGQYTVAGDLGNIQANGTAMGGGTTRMVSVVTQEDIEIAAQKALEGAADDVRGKLSRLLSDDNLIPIPDTFVSTQGDPQSSVAVDQQADGNVTLNIEITSTMLGISLDEVAELIEAKAQEDIDSQQERVYETGANAASITVSARPSPDSARLVVVAVAKIGPLLDENNLATEISGMRSGEAKQILESRSGITSTDIYLRPFWVFSLPKDASKIDVIINE